MGALPSTYRLVQQLGIGSLVIAIAVSFWLVYKK
jgi:hypothetical protein